MWSCYLWIKMSDVKVGVHFPLSWFTAICGHWWEWNLSVTVQSWRHPVDGYLKLQDWTYFVWMYMTFAFSLQLCIVTGKYSQEVIPQSPWNTSQCYKGILILRLDFSSIVFNKKSYYSLFSHDILLQAKSQFLLSFSCFISVISILLLVTYIFYCLYIK